MQKKKREKKFQRILFPIQETWYIYCWLYIVELQTFCASGFKISLCLNFKLFFPIAFLQFFLINLFCWETFKIQWKLFEELLKYLVKSFRLFLCMLNYMKFNGVIIWCFKNFDLNCICPFSLMLNGSVEISLKFY